MRRFEIRGFAPLTTVKLGEEPFEIRGVSRIALLRIDRDPCGPVARRDALPERLVDVRDGFVPTKLGDHALKVEQMIPDCCRVGTDDVPDDIRAVLVRGVGDAGDGHARRVVMDRLTRLGIDGLDTELDKHRKRLHHIAELQPGAYIAPTRAGAHEQPTSTLSARECETMTATPPDQLATSTQLVETEIVHKILGSVADPTVDFAGYLAFGVSQFDEPPADPSDPRWTAATWVTNGDRYGLVCAAGPLYGAVALAGPIGDLTTWHVFAGMDDGLTQFVILYSGTWSFR